MSSDPGVSVPFSEGEVLAGKYRIDRVLGAGGMGVVVAATHLDLDAKVAIKVMRQELAQNDAAVHRLLLEARAAAKIQSEHVARVIDVSTLPSGTPYIVMEYLEGVDLGRLLETDGPLDSPVAVSLLLEAGEALAEAHAAGIVHRDLKPENLFLAHRNDGSRIIKVLDFGISKQLNPGTQVRSLTNPSTAIGSPQYMAPEQMQARPVDVRADIWAMGTILYQLLSGRHAFEGNTLPEVCAQVLGQDPKPLTLWRANLPPELESIVARCMRKDPTQRYADIAELALALAPFGTPDARGSAERIVRVLRGTGTVPLSPGQARVARLSSAVEATQAAQPETGAASVVSTELARQNEGSLARWLAGAIGAGFVVLGSLWFTMSGPPDESAVPPPDGPAPAPAAAATPAPTSPGVVLSPTVVEPAVDPEPTLENGGEAEPPGASPTVSPKPAAVRASPDPARISPNSTETKPSRKAPKRTAPTPQTAPASDVQKAWDLESFGGRR